MLVRFAPTELATIRERARKCGMPTARFIREASLGAVPRARHAGNHDALLHELARISSALAQLARTAQPEERVEPHADIKAALAELSSAVRRRLLPQRLSRR